jgi:uncharacterized Ntn-hydrolase superfamily protein
MPVSRRVAFLLVLLLCALPLPATWSILIVDLATGEVAIGIATCLTGFDLKPNTVVVVPGYGIAVAQSAVGPLNLRAAIREQLLLGTPAAQILAQLAAIDPGHQIRQYGIASLTGGAVAFTGGGAGTWAGHLTGQIGSLVYTVQGNVLTGLPVNTAAEVAIRTTNGTLADKLMAAMEAAAAMGGDGRCSCNGGNPTACGSPPVAFTKSAHIGLMIVSRPSDVDASCAGSTGCGGGEYWLDLNVRNQQASDPDPVVQLRQLYNVWRAQQAGRPDHYTSTVVLGGTRIRANGHDEITATVTLRDANGTPLGATLPLELGLNHRSTVRGVTFSPAVPQPNGTYTFTLRGDLDAGLAIVDVAARDAAGRVGIHPQPVVTVDDAFGACGTGAIADGQGGVRNALQVAGSAGDDRVVEVGLAQPFVLSLDPPANVAALPPVGMYALWAHLGLPAPSGVLPFGPGGGALCFLPAPFDPRTPSLLVADSFGFGGAFGTGPAPWQVGFPGVPALLDATLQGAMVVDAQGSVAATNALLLRVVPVAPPILQAIVPPAPAAGASVTLTGSRFLHGCELRVDGAPVPIVAQTATSLTFVMPAGVGCDRLLSLANPGTSPVSLPINPTPVVHTMPYANGPAAGGAFFVVTGLWLTGATVTIGGAPLVVTSRTSTSIVGTTPAGGPGQAQVTVGNSRGCAVQRVYVYQ